MSTGKNFERGPICGNCPFNIVGAIAAHAIVPKPGQDQLRIRPGVMLSSAVQDREGRLACRDRSFEIIGAIPG